MRLFLSPYVKVYYLYFKGSKSSRGAGERHCSSEEEEQETEDAALEGGWEVAPGSLLQKEPSSRGHGSGCMHLW